VRSNESWESALAAQLRRRHPRVGRVAVAVFNWKDVFTTDGAFSPARFRLAVNSVCVAGRNMTRMLAPQRIDSASMNGDILSFRPAHAERFGTAGRRQGSPDRVRAAAMDAGHAVLAAAFALVMEREQIYTEDLDLRRDLFTLNYPGRTRDWRKPTRWRPPLARRHEGAGLSSTRACRWLDADDGCLA
jgi:hypothetical protein